MTFSTQRKMMDRSREFTLAQASTETRMYQCGHEGPTVFKLWLYEEMSKSFRGQFKGTREDKCPDCMSEYLKGTNPRCPTCKRYYVPGRTSVLDHVNCVLSHSNIQAVVE